jgi:hypothetical protein
MPPPRIQRSILRYPLDSALGTPAMVRLIRVLVHDVNGPVGVTDAAQRAGLTRAGARRSLEVLERLGVAARLGTGRTQKFAPKEGNPLLPFLRELFMVEQRQYEDLLRGLRDAVGIPEVRAAWMLNQPAETSPVLELEVIAETRAIDWIGAELRARIAGLEKRFNLIVELDVFTRADSPEIPEDAVMLWGLGASAAGGPSERVQTHAESAVRSLRMARAIAEMIKSDPSLIQRAIHYTNRLLHEGQGTANADIGEWRQLLETYSPERLRELLGSRSSRAERLRRSSPFFAVLTPDERDRMLKQMEAEK